MVHLKETVGTLKLYTQCIATGGVLLLIAQTGIMGGWTSPNIARLTQENSTIPITLSQASWVASYLNLGRFLGAILVPIMIELAGSRKTVLSILFPFGTSWVLLTIANSVEWLYAARFIGGMCFGMAYGSFSLYLGEIAAPNFRGSLITVAMCGGPLGSVIGTIGETYLPMNISSFVYLAQCLVAILLFLWLPDTPFWMMKKRDEDGARKSIAWYRGDYELDKEVESIKNFVEASSDKSIAEKLKFLRTPQMRSALLLIIALFFFPQMCGMFSIMFYMEIIFMKAQCHLLDPKELVIYSNVISVVSTILAIRLIDRLGRRFLLCLSGVGTAVALTGLGLHFSLLDSSIDPEYIQWLPVASILMFTITFTIGFMTVPSTVLSEIFPASVKSTAAFTASLTSAFFGFVASKAYQPMVDEIGEAYVFWIHAVFAILAVPCAIFWLPETKGKSFQEIQDRFFKTSLRHYRRQSHSNQPSRITANEFNRMKEQSAAGALRSEERESRSESRCKP